MLQKINASKDGKMQKKKDGSRTASRKGKGTKPQTKNRVDGWWASGAYGAAADFGVEKKVQKIDTTGISAAKEQTN